MAAHTAGSGPGLGVSLGPWTPLTTRWNCAPFRVLGQSSQSSAKPRPIVGLGTGGVNPRRGDTSTVKRTVPVEVRPWGRSVQTTCWVAAIQDSWDWVTDPSPPPPRAGEVVAGNARGR